MTQPFPSPQPKRRVVYLRHRRIRPIAENLRLNQDEWLETMSVLTDLTLVTEDFDMQELCDRLKPDFIIYEAAGLFPAPLEITHPRAHPEIPRFGFQMQDPHDTVRVFFLRQMEKLGSRYMFTHLTEAAVRQSPELDGHMYSVSLIFDEELFRDYGLPKDIPVSIFGGALAPTFYHWRAEIVRTIAEFFPTLIYTHPGYESPIPRSRFPISGVPFAQMINRSHFSLADSTRLDYLVRKHLEVPAARSVLIAPDAEVLKPYGFRDMENCILGSGMALYQKMADVANDPALYERICQNGYDLVTRRFGRKNWTYFLDFYECVRTLKPGEVVQQQGMLGPFKNVPGDVYTPAITGTVPDSEFTLYMKKAQDILLANGSVDEAYALLKVPAQWLAHMTEPLKLIGVVALLKGQPQQAKSLFMTHYETRKDRNGVYDYDPVEISWLSLTGALLGDSELLELTRRESAAMRHVSLRRVEWLGKVLASGGDMSSPPDSVKAPAPDDQLSIHWMGQPPLELWIGLIRRILAANGHGHILK